MDRNSVDIPEVFRKAFEKDRVRRQGGGNGGGDNGGRRGGGGPVRPLWTRRWFWIALLIFLLLISFNWIVTTYTEWLWFTSLEYQKVWLTQWGYRAATTAVAFVVAAIVLLVNLRLAFKTAKETGPISGLRLLTLPGIGQLVTASGAFIALVFGAAAGGHWENILLFFNRQPFGTADPIFNLDLGFYIFQLPVFRFLQSWLTPLFIITLVGVLALYLVDNWAGLQRGEWRPLSSEARRHIAIMAALAMIFWALGYWLDMYELLYSSRGVAFGASYTDLRATRPALYAQMALMILLAAAALFNAFRPALRPLLIIGGLWLAATILLGAVYPSILQRYTVEPNELSRERPYIEHNINFTRMGYDLSDLNTKAFGSLGELTKQDLDEHKETLKNVRLWDYRPLQLTYGQLQELRPYYTFSSIDIDRYEIDGEIRQVMLAGRELDKDNLTAPSWINQKLMFTHGYGVVMNPVDEVTPQGQPNFFIKDLPPQSSVDIEVTRPEIYSGEVLNDVVFVGSDQPEFDYPIGNDNAASSYEGVGGVELSSGLRRLAFAIRLGETNLLLSQDITSDTRVLLHRQIQERVQRITPFLSFDNDPYLVIAGGRLVWMIDGYTLSSNFPYSSPTNSDFNYIRNAVKVTIDAYDGTVTYYMSEPDDPLIQSYARAFPGLFHPLDEMPAELQAHIRYPEDLFLVQTQKYLKYHMTNVQVFYNQEDLWEIPQEVFDSNQQAIEPYYVYLALPGEEEPEFLLIQPYTPAGKNNMIAWVAARNDKPNYGELVVYELPKQELVFGPIQVEARIDQDPEISAQISLWNQRGSRVIRGNLIVIPIGDSFLYVEPLYLLADTSELPELKRVIVASGDRITMDKTLEGALAALVEGGPIVTEVVDKATGEEGATADTEVETGERPTLTEGGAIDETTQSLIQSANAHFEAAEAAQREGDWATYGRELEALQGDLQRLMDLTEGTLE
jgi:uncharacterized membrane protein (UPF0182 family)